MTWRNTPLPSPAEPLAPRYAWVLLPYMTPALHPLLVVRVARDRKGNHVWRFCTNGNEVLPKSVAQWAPASDSESALHVWPAPSASFDPTPWMRSEDANSQRILLEKRIADLQGRLATAEQHATEQHNVITRQRHQLHELETLAPVSVRSGANEHLHTENQRLKDEVHFLEQRLKLFAEKLIQFGNDINPSNGV